MNDQQWKRLQEQLRRRVHQINGQGAPMGTGAFKALSGIGGLLALGGLVLFA